MKYLSTLVLLLLVMTSCVPEQPMESQVPGEWTFRKLREGEALRGGDLETWRMGEGRWHKANVPGCVHLDLLANGVIEDPFYGENEKELQWIGETAWEYSTVIIPDSSILEKKNIELVFEGLDTYAEVYLNDSLILRAYNMFRKWEVDVNGILKEGENNLSITFFPPGEMNERQAEDLSYALPDIRAFTRKAPYHFGWDWGPEFVTCGIWKEMHINAWDGFQIKEVHIDYESIEGSSIPIMVHVNIESDAEQIVTLIITDEDSGLRLASEKIVLKTGMNRFGINAVILNPELWWPTGLGDQKIYTVRTSILGVEIMDAASTKFGLREIELVREPDEFGESFFFKVNGLPVFMKGANYIPQDNFLPRVDTAKYEQLIQSVVDANMNMLRVWGGGFYENDIFYDLCDQHGILIWQDFMFACNMYPGDDFFLENVKQEAIDNVSRLSNHPSIALWCGNNEMDEGWHNWGWQKSLEYSAEDSTKVWSDYLKVFHDILPNIVEKYDPGTIYWPSSPMTGWGRDEAYARGDVHYWGVWWGEEPFEMYPKKIGRFVSEYGFQGMPPLETIESFTGSRIHSIPNTQHSTPDVLEAHQKHPRGTELIQKYMDHEFIVPEDFENYVYVSQVLQAEGMAEAFLSHRASQPYCMGTLYWQLNDCWPVTSWSGLDYYGRWKALHYHVKRAYASIMVTEMDEGNTIAVYAVNDHPYDVEVDFSMENHNNEGLKRVTKDGKEVLPALSSKKIASFPKPLEVRGNIVNVSTLQIGDSILSRSFYYFVPTKDMNLPDPGLTYEISGSDSGPKITIKTEKLARQVFLEAQGLNGRFEDNFFDMAAGETRIIRYLGSAGTDELSSHLKIKSIYNTLN